MQIDRRARLHELRLMLGALEPGPGRGRAWPFGDGRLDRHLPAGGLPLGCWHALEALGRDAELGAAAGAFVARLAAGIAGVAGRVVWVLRRPDLHPPGAAGLGLDLDRLVLVQVRTEAEVAAVLEEVLATAGVGVAIGELDRIDGITGRRWQLAAERSGATGLVLRRHPWGRAVGRQQAATAAPAAGSWRIATAPSVPVPGEPGLGPRRWQVELLHCRGGRPGSWILEAGDGAHPFRVVSGAGGREQADASLDAAADAGGARRPLRPLRAGGGA